MVGAFEIRIRTLVYEQLETRETLTLTPNLTPNLTSTLTLTLTLTLTGNCLNLTTGTQVVRCTVS